ncbi:MAG: RdgB/HAM1 family non-canonical purine NTP pyrophosphatase [Acidimicrobiales bacterium]
MTTYVLATANPHKAAEMQEILAPLGVQLVPRPAGVPDVDETEDTLEGNALLKARALCAATGLAAIADDTGLFVDALDGRPGVLSARFAGDTARYQDNTLKLLDELSGVAPPRTAHFTSVIVVASPDGGWWSVEGVLDGVIIEAARGSGGFGYDPVFELLGEDRRTLAELTPAEKNVVSHRGRALRALVEKLVAG